MADITGRVTFVAETREEYDTLVINAVADLGVTIFSLDEENLTLVVDLGL